MKHFSYSRWLVVVGFLFMIAIAPSIRAQVSLTTINSPYSQDFNTLANTGTSSTVPMGFTFVESGTSANITYAAGTGSGTTGDTYSFGTTSATDRAFGGLRSGSVVPTIGASFVNNTSTTITSLSITYTGEQWRLGALSREDRLDFQYSTSATSLTAVTYTDVDALDFVAPVTTGTVGMLDGNMAANRTAKTSTISGLSISPGATFWIRFSDLDAISSDDGLAIDDFSLTPIGVAPCAQTVTNTNTGATFCTIQAAIDAVNTVNGHTLSVGAGTFDELVTVSKSLTISGEGNSSVVTYTGTAIPVPGSVTPTLFKVTVSNVAIQNLAMNVDLSKIRSAIHTSGTTPNLTVVGNTITPSGTPGNNYGIRNAIAINPNLTNNDYTYDNVGFTGVVVKANTVNISAGGILSSFRAAVQMDLSGGTIGGSNPADGNTFTSINHDVNVRFPNQGPVIIQNNTSLGGGIQLAETNPGGGQITIANNSLSGATVQPSTGQLGTGALMRIQNNGGGIPVSVANNTFTNFRWAMSVENFNAITLNGNSFTPLANSTDYRIISFNTKLLASTSATIPPVNIGAVLTNNTFNGSGAAGGTGIAFFNHRQDGATPAIGTFTLGQAGQENTFNAGIATFLRLDNSTGPSSGFGSPFGEYTVSNAPSTTMNYWTPDLNAANNRFDVGTGLKLARDLNSAERMTLDGQLFDKNDDANVGRILYYFPVRNLTQNTDFPTIQSAVDAANAGDVLSAGAGNYPEAVTVTKSLTILGANAGVAGFAARAAESVIDGAGTRTGLVVSANNVLVDGFKFTAGQGTYGAALAFNGQQTGAQVLNNIFSDNVVGVVEPTANAAIKRNLFDGNNRTGPAGGSGIYTDVPTNGLTIEDNEFKNHTNNSAVVFGATASNTHQNLVFARNNIHDNNIDNSMVYCVAINGGTFSQNTITQPGTTALKFAGANSAIMVLNNFLDNNGVGVRIADDGFGLGGNTGIEVHNNSLSNNTSKAIDNQQAPTINATCNWYGTTNVDAQAASLFSGSVTYSPYLSSGTDNEGGTPGFQPVPGSCTSLLSLTLTASPDMLLTSGTTTLSATVSGGNTPITYTFTGPGTITQSPASNTASVSNIPAGVQTFTVVASDATTPTSQSISGTVSVTVTQANTAPVATANDNQTATVGVAFSYMVNAFSDAETPNQLTYTASISPANGLSFDPNTRIISGVPSMSGVSSVTVTATDPGSLSASTSFTITVNPAPVVVTPLSLTLTASPDMLTTSGTTTLSATVSGGTTPYSYTFSGPGTINQSGNTATVSNLPTGVQTFTVVASDATSPTSQSISGTVSVTVTQANTPPTVANPVPPQSATVGIAYTLSLANVFTDAETPNQLTLSVSGLPAGLNFTAPSTISGTPSMSGVSSVTVTATDPGSLTASNTFTITVSPAPVVVTPLALTLTASPDMLTTSGTTTLSATVSGGTTPYSYTFSGPGTITQSGNTATVSNLPTGVQTFTVVVSDATSPTSQTISGTVSVTVTQAPPANTAPVATANDNQTATVGVAFSYTVNAFSDAETPNQLTYTASIMPANGLSFNPSNRVISGTPSMSGVSSVTVTATDPGSLSASTSFTITVNPAAGNPPPTATFSITGVTTVSCETISAGQRRVSFNPRYAGLDGSPVSFSVVNELTPTTAPGPYTLNLYTDNPVITLQATQSGATTQFAYNWLSACSSSTGNTPPTVANPVPPQSATVGVGYTLSLANVFTDAETPNALVLSVTGLPAGLNFNPPSTISGTPSMSGVSTVTVTATDPGSMSASTSFTITVNPAAGTPPPPTGTFSITGVTTISCEVLSAGERRLTFNPRYAGVNGAPISFSVVNELTPTTNPGPYTLDLYTDNPVVTLQAVQSGVSSSFAYNWLAVCSSTTANTPPTVANPVPPQSATVGTAYTLSLANVFTDAETPNQLTLSVTGLPAGLSFSPPSTISGTPSMSGVSNVTVTATDPGSMSASTSFTINVNPAGATPPPTGTFSITGVTTVSCQVISAGERRVTFNPRYAGLDGSPVSFSVVNELLPTTAPGPYTLNLYTDNSVITLSAVQNGVSSTFSYNWLAACTPSAPGARVSGEPTPGLQLQVLGNPVSTLISVLVTGAAGGSLNLVLTDEQGQRVNQFSTERALSAEKVQFEVGHLPAGILLLRASTPTQTKTIRILKEK